MGLLSWLTQKLGKRGCRLGLTHTADTLLLLAIILRKTQAA